MQENTTYASVNVQSALSINSSQYIIESRTQKRTAPYMAMSYRLHETQPFSASIAMINIGRISGGSAMSNLIIIIAMIGGLYALIVAMIFISDAVKKLRMKRKVHHVRNVYRRKEK